MKRFLLIFVIATVTSCSFDNKTGIWKDASNIPVDTSQPKSIEDEKTKNYYADIFEKNAIYNKEKQSSNPSSFAIDPSIKVVNWFEQYATATNNISNYSYNDNKTLFSRSSKLKKTVAPKAFTDQSIIFYNNHLISYDHKGTIFIYSINLKKKIFKYNFYKKKFKNFKKKIYLIVNKNTLYVSDNLGYLYAINLKNKSLVWAKNYGIPFRSNLKFVNEQIFLVNQDNTIYSINAKNGAQNWQFQTTPTFLKSDFQNSIALDVINNNFFLYNTSGELYSISYEKKNINWVINFKKRTLTGDSDLFLGKPLIIKNNYLIVSTEKSILSYKSENGSKNWSFATSPALKPIATSNYIYLITKNELLICLNQDSGEVIWSKSILKILQENKIRNKIGNFVDFKIVNNKINLYSENGYLLSFNYANGNLNFLNRISKKGINSEVIFLNNNMILLDKKNRLLIYN